MAIGERNTNVPWRQGHLLKRDAIDALQLDRGLSGDDVVAIVATHDCDLIQSIENEPNIEIIIGCKIEKENGNFTHAKEPRTLHISFDGGGEPLLVEFKAANKIVVNKKSLLPFLPDSVSKLNKDSFATFQLWLALRYRRSAFPDRFENRLKGQGLHTVISKVIKSHGQEIIAVCFDVDGGEDLPKIDENDTYTLDIDILYSTSKDPTQAKKVAEDASTVIKGAFENKCKKDGEWVGIELRSCEPISDQVLTYAKYKQLKKWKLDHISMRDDPQGEVML